MIFCLDKEWRSIITPLLNEEKVYLQFVLSNLVSQRGSGDTKDF